jgi:murein L,D-transpeptidase YafK
MRFFFLIVIFYCSNIISIEKNQSVQQSNFFDKKPAEQRKIFIQKFKNLISQKNTAEEKKEQLKTPTRDIKTVESLLIESLELISNEQLDQASKIIDELIVLAPNFKLAHLIRGDILTAYSMSINNFGGSAIEINSEKVKELKKEAQRRIKGYLISNKDISLPKFNILPAKKDKYLIYVDMDSSRLFVFQNMNGKYFYMSDYYVSIGKNGYGKRFEGDKKTPFGTYFIQKKIQRQLIDFYGDGAYPLNYPNKFDKINNFTGSGIWIHGTPKSTYSRPPEASDGCIVLSNKDLVEIKNILNTIGTPIILSNLSITKLSLRKEEDIKEDQEQIINSIKNWKESWVSANYNEYINFYSPKAIYNNSEYRKWTRAKKNIFNKSKNIQISLNDISIYEYPSETEELRLVIFNQDYRSNLITNKTKKKQLWKVENEKWKIIYEGIE